MSDPAFPNGRDVTNGLYEPHGGMTQRQYYKAKALAGLMANARLVRASPSLALGVRDLSSAEIACICGGLADAMLAEDAKHETK